MTAIYIQPVEGCPAGITFFIPDKDSPRGTIFKCTGHGKEKPFCHDIVKEILARGENIDSETMALYANCTGDIRYDEVNEVYRHGTGPEHANF